RTACRRCDGTPCANFRLLLLTRVAPDSARRNAELAHQRGLQPARPETGFSRGATSRQSGYLLDRPDTSPRLMTSETRAPLGLTAPGLGLWRMTSPRARREWACETIPTAQCARRIARRAAPSRSPSTRGTRQRTTGGWA